MSKVVRKKKMMILWIIIAGILLVTLWFNIPYSHFKNQFRKDVAKRCLLSEQSEGVGAQIVFSKEVFAGLPPLLQNYLETCGYIGSPRKSVLNMEYKKVDFALGLNRPKLKIDYCQLDFADAPTRLAFIDSKMFGVPFQGYDYYIEGKGGMRGVLAKLFKLFDQTGKEMDKACLVTYLAEIIFLPEAMLQDFVTFNQIDGHTIEAKIEYKGVTASGKFHFNDVCEMICFSTDERGQSVSDGTSEYIPWEAQCQEYKVYSDGIKRPTIFRAVWKYPDQDFVYFDGKISNVDGVEVK